MKKGFSSSKRRVGRTKLKLIKIKQKFSACRSTTEAALMLKDLFIIAKMNKNKKQFKNN